MKAGIAGLIVLIAAGLPAAAADLVSMRVGKDGFRPSEVAAPLTKRIDFTSSVSGQRYSLMIGLPFAPPPKDGYAVLYAFDGGGFFGTLLDAVRGTNQPIVVVGLSYPFDDPDFVAGQSRTAKDADGSVAFPAVQSTIQVTRNRDLTPPAPKAFVESLGATLDAKQGVGGVDAYLKTIEADVKPRVAAFVPVNPKNLAIFGHSLGGLAVLEALFTEPAAFRTFIASSPSIWWNDRAILQREPEFAAKVRSGSVSPRILITVGALEQTPQPVPKGAPITQAQADALNRRARMVDNAVELAARLKGLKASAPFEAAHVVFADEDHGSVEPAAAARAVRFASAPLAP